MLLARTHCIDMDSLYWRGLMVWTWNHGVHNTHRSARRCYCWTTTTPDFVIPIMPYFHSYKSLFVCHYEKLLVFSSSFYTRKITYWNKWYTYLYLMTFFYLILIFLKWVLCRKYIDLNTHNCWSTRIQCCHSCFRDYRAIKV